MRSEWEASPPRGRPPPASEDAPVVGKPPEPAAACGPGADHAADCNSAVQATASDWPRSRHSARLAGTATLLWLIPGNVARAIRRP